MKRYIEPFVVKDCVKKIILISGPRQSGKTTFAKNLFHEFEYLNYDAQNDRHAITKMQWKRNVQAVLFDELHKMPEWKRWLKGIYDTEGNKPHIIVTGSANLEIFKKAGDSLAGRYFRFRMHPIDLKEARLYWKDDVQEIFNRLMTVGGFPEPFLEGKTNFHRRWQKSHLDIMLRQDFLDLYAVRSLKSLEVLLSMLESRVGGSISYANLANDLQVDSKTVRSWIDMLENIYAVFRVTPYHKNIARSILKEPKFYFYDLPRASTEGARLENLVACALLKELNFVEDTEGFSLTLHYLRTKDGNEIDFLIVCNDKPVLAIEVKTSDDQPSKNFNVFRNFIGDIPCVQLVLNLKKEFDTQDGVQVRNLIDYLSHIDFSGLFS
nr:uncharcterized ATPase [uncultured bacterium]